ncbi:MAG: YIP1 family protein [Euryarchaeota archaeon]|nr:YIP1 family protein [Euryarchaeota archaeon]
MEQIDRAVRIVQNPQVELNKVKSEKISKEYLIKQYIAILAIIPAVAYIIGWGFIGMGWFGRSIEAAVVGGILTYILSIAGFYVTGLVINALAPNFTSKQNEIQAMKLAAYSYTPMLLGGIFNIIPALGIIGLLFALYGLYILYLGIPVLMETPADKALTYTIVIIVAMMVIYLVMGSIIAAITISMSPVPGMMGVIPQ